MRAIFIICGSESQPGLQLVAKLAAPLAAIDLFHNGGPLIYSVLSMIISLCDLDRKEKFFCILHMLTRSERLIIIHIQQLFLEPRARMGSESISASWVIDLEAMRARGIIVLVKSN